MKLQLSVVVIAKNEERNIERCLKSVQWADELLVVDGGSSDQTVALARQCGARVIYNEWLGFGPQKAFGARQAKNDWILSLDADEVVGPELTLEIQQRFPSLHPETAYQLPRRSYFMGRWILHGGWYPNYQTRLFHRGHAMWDDSSIHEQVKCEKLARFNGDLLHYVFKDISHQVSTNNRYSSLLAKKDFAGGRRFSLFNLLVKPPVKFFECYFLKQGFRDGLPGFAIAVSAAYSVFLRWLKIWEIGQQRQA